MNTLQENAPVRTKINIYDFEPVHKEEIHRRLVKVLQPVHRTNLVSPVLTIISELLHHCLRHNYKYIFEKYMIHEFGWAGEPEARWVELFQSELDSNRTANFAARCRDNNLPVGISFAVDRETLALSISHMGKLSGAEVLSIQELLQKVKSGAASTNALNHPREEIIQNFKPGLPLALLCFQGLGISGKKIRISFKNERTRYTFSIPYGEKKIHSLFHTLDKESQKELLYTIFEDLKYNTMIFNAEGDILEISPDIFQNFHIPEENREKLYTLIPPAFYQDIFYGPFSVHNFRHFENYRISIPGAGGSHLFNVSGLMIEKNKVATLWQPVTLGSKENSFSEGSVFQNINLIKMVQPYIPKMVLNKARDALRSGSRAMPIENRVATIMFTDLIGFTRISEFMEHAEVVELLNQTMKIIVGSIERNGGYVDKFMGDGVMSVFFDPMEATVSALEIQNNFLNLNEFREINNKPPIEIRIGINTGKIILGSVGSGDRMDWTALGDVVNTASRIESSSQKNKVLVGKNTYEQIKDKVEVEKAVQIQFKGKNELQELYFIRGAKVMRNGEEKLLALGGV